MTVTWPTNLPLGIKYGALLELGGFNSKSITDMESGAIRRRRRIVNKRGLLSVSVKYDDNLLEIFKTFYHEATLEGTKPFVATVIDGARAATVRCEFYDETITPEATSYDYWTLNFKLVVRTISFVPWSVVQFWDQYGADIINWEDWLDEVVNTDWPPTMVFANGVPYITESQDIPSLLNIDFTSGGNGLVAVRWYQTPGSEDFYDPNDFLTVTSPVTKNVKDARGIDYSTDQIVVDHDGSGNALGMQVHVSDDIVIDTTLFPWNSGTGTLTVNGSTVTPILSGSDLDLAAIAQAEALTHITNVRWVPS